MYDKTVPSVIRTDQLVHLFGKDCPYFVTVPDVLIKRLKPLDGEIKKRTNKKRLLSLTQ